MQRQNSILKSRKGFAMILAIALIVLISTIMVVSLNMSAQSSQRSINDYIHEQEYFVAKSATEMALLRVSEQDRATSGCLEGFTMTYPQTNPIFDVSVSIKYIGLNCSNSSANISGASSIDTAESRGTMMVDVRVTPNASIHLGQELAYHKRTIQKL